MADVHLLIQDTPLLAACGADGRTPGSWQMTRHKVAVSCPLCMNTPAFARAIQRIPSIPKGMYNG